MIKPHRKTDYDGAEYIREMTGDLAAIARQEGLDMLAYILDMARLEAHRHLNPDYDRAEASSGSSGAPD